MLDKLIGFVLHQKLLVILAAVVLLTAGAVAWQNLPIDAFPDTTNVQVMVLTEAEGLAPDDIERLITVPIEIEMGGLPGVRQVRSLSRAGLSQVVVIFDDDVETHFSRRLVFQRLSQARDKLPKGVEPELGPISTGLGEIYQYALESGYYCPDHPNEWSRIDAKCGRCGKKLTKSEYDLIGLRTLQDWTISPQLRRLAGINEINSFGGFVKQFHVLPRPEMLLKYGISLTEIVEALELNNANAAGGFLVEDWEQMNVVSKGLIRNIIDIKRIVLKAEDGSPVYLGDVAEVRIGRQTRNGAVTKDGRGEAVVGMAIMLKGANSKDVVDRVRAAIPEIQKSLPAGVKITPFYDRTDLIQACVSTVSTALGQGIVLIVLVLFLLLWDLRAALIVAILLPLTAAVTFLLMGWRDMTANLMSLGGLTIAIGMVVDAGIVITENISRHMRLKADTDLTRTEIAFQAVREVARPVTFAVAIIIVVFLPLFTLESMEGKMFKPLALTIIFALLGSLAASLTIIPVLGALLIKRKRTAGAGPARPHSGEHRETNPLVRAIRAAYKPILSLAMRGRWITIAIAAGLMVGTFALLPTLGTEFLPPLDEGALAINLVRLPTASVEGSAIQCSEMERRLLAKFPEVTTVVSKTGRAEIAEDPMGPEQSDLLIMLKPRDQWRQGLTSEKLVADVAIELAAFPGVRPAFSQPIALRVNELISGIKSDLAIKIFGDDIDVLREAGEKIAPLLAAIEGAEDVKIEQVSGFSQIEVKHNHEAMARRKINSSDINTLVETAIGGKVATTVYEGQKRFDVLVRYPEEARKNIESIRDLLVPSPAGYNAPLSELATVEKVEVPAQVSREDFTRRLIIECNIRGRDIGSFVNEAKEKLAAVEQALPTGYRLGWGGQFENQQRAMARLRVVVPISLLLIFVLVFTTLGSIRSTLLVLPTLPFSLVGGILAIYLLDINLSVSAAIGFIALLGVAVEDGLLLVSYCDRLRREGLGVTDAVAQACRVKIRPIIMTTMTTVLGLGPLLYATGSGSEIQKPLVAVVFGGMISSLVLTLIILPVLYMLMNSDKSGPAATADA